ncbi:MAG: hypothetical protein ACFFC3_01100 [Candidatus Odinarchaeota archaeon]
MVYARGMSKKQKGLDQYPTIKYISDILDVFTRISPKEWITQTGRSKGRIKETIISKKFMGKSKGYLTAMKGFIDRYDTPDFTFNKDLLNHLIKEVNAYFGEKAQNIIKLTKRYKKLNPNLKEYTREQYQLHNPNLKSHYFDIINTISKAYWLGFLRADGWISSRGGKYEIGIHLANKDKLHLERFASTIGIDPSKIRPHHKLLESTGKIYPGYEFVFGCKPMFDALVMYGFKVSKSHLTQIPKFRDIPGEPSSRQLLLAFLRGYYDGDGRSGSNNIGAASKRFLVRIRHALDIKYPIIRESESYSYIDDSGKIHILHSFYSLNLGVLLFNEMSLACKLGDVSTLGRKDRVAHLREQSLDILKAKLDILGLDKNDIQDMVYNHPQFKLVKVIDNLFTQLGLKTSRYIILDSYPTNTWTFNLLRKEWGITLPPKGYWRANDKDKFLSQM